MVKSIVPDNQIQCDYSTLNELVDALNRALYWQRVTLAIHRLDGIEPDRMSAGFGGIYAIFPMFKSDSDTDIYVDLHVHGYGHISVPNTPLVFDGVEHVSEITIEDGHVSMRYAYLAGVGESRRLAKVYYIITALQSLDD